VGIPHVDVLLFVGVAVAWAIYLIPKAIHHHEQATRSRGVDRFSHRLRVLARREPVSPKDAELVVPGRAPVPAEESVRLADSSGRVSAPVSASAGASLGSAVSSPGDSAAHPAPGSSPVGIRVEVRAAQARRQREAARRATRRRRRVLGLVLLALAGVAGTAAYGAVSWWYTAVPGALLVAWLVACRVMVRGERAARRRPARAVPAGSSSAEAPESQALDMDETTEIARVAATEPGMWDPVPVTLPTYVDKPAATRTVRSIDLEAEGVWTSGRTQADAALARKADADAAAARAAREPEDDQRAAGAAG
jgi:hypothetical protein